MLFFRYFTYVFFPFCKQRKRHFWRLDTKCITMFQSDTSSNFYREILLSELLAIEPNEIGGFTLVTKHLRFFCGENNVTLCRNWQSAIRQAYMPPLPDKNNAKQGKTTDRFHGNEIRGAMANRDLEDREDGKENAEQSDIDISLQYQIFPDEVLGSGQFGVVYGGVHRNTGLY